MALQDNELITNEVRLSYVNLFEAKEINKNGKPQFSVKLLIQKGDTKTIESLKAAKEAAKKLGLEPKKAFSTMSQAQLDTMTLSLADGDDAKWADNPECKGHWLLNAKSPADKQPGVLIQTAPGTNVHVTNQTDIYSGMFGMVHLQLYPYNKAGNAGIGAALINVLKTKDGDPLGGAVRKKAEEVFGGASSPFDTAAPATVAGGSPV